MIIPSKHSGYRAGIRLYHGGGGDGPGGGGDPSTGGDARAGSGFAGTGSGLAGTGVGAAQAGVGGGETGYGLGNYASSTIASLMGTDSQGNARAGTNAGQIGGFDGGGYGGDNTNNSGSTTVKPVTPTPNPASVIAPDNPALKAIGGSPYNQSGQYYNSLLQQGYSDSAIRNALTTQGGPVSDPNYEALIQNAGMVSSTGRPMAGSGQFTQPVYNSQYQNYARPSTQFSTSLYGTQPMRSPAFNSGMSRGNINQTIGDFYKTNPRADANSALDFMRSSGVNREDFQAYGGLNNYGPQMSAPSMQTQQSFNPYTNAPQQQYNPFSYYDQPYQQSRAQPMSVEYPYQQPRQQQYSPFSYQQPQQQQYSPFSYQQQPQQPQYSPFSYQQPQQQQYSPFSYQQPQSQRRELNPYQQYEKSLGSYNPYSSQEQYNPYSSQEYNPYQMQSPFNYQQPRYDDSYQQPQPQPVMSTSSGPSKAIVGRSSGSRGTPNVMRRAEGGIAGILKK